MPNLICVRTLEAYKFQDDYRLRQIFVKTLQDHCKRYLHRGWLVVVIPVDEQTLATRGFDQVVGFTRYT